MVLVLAVLLIRPVYAAQGTVSPEKIALLQPAESRSASLAPSRQILLPFPQVQMDILLMQPVNSDLTAAPSESAPAPVRALPAIALLKPSPARKVSVDELAAENRGNLRLWLGLAVASHSAATFDAWSTRHAITTGAGRELNPLFRPFAGNASLYAAIQAGPLLMDYIGKKMYSRHDWMRRIWWIPQSVSVAASLFCGAHNLGIRPAAN